MKSELVLKVPRKLVDVLGMSYTPSYQYDMIGEASSKYIKNEILTGKPFLTARIGATEFKCISGYLNEQGKNKKYFDYFLKKTDALSINEEVISQAHMWSGIFPPQRETIEQFAKLSLQDLKDVDVLGVWLKEELLLKERLKKKTLVPLSDIEPYYHQTPWTVALNGKKVLVIHPFAQTIKLQYDKHELLFDNPAVLPKFDLKVITSVQSIAGQLTPFASWFEALEHMKSQMDNTDYDIAIIGCGAYGLSLGAHAKRMGKQAVHLGGATQILFGIKGARWDNHPKISKLYRSSWVRPSKNETPENKDKVEDGCYW